MANMMTQFVNQITNFLDECNTEKAIELLKADSSVTEEGLGRVMSVIVLNLTSSVLQHKKAAFECSSNVLMFIAENCDPKLTILEFLKHVPHTGDHVNFCAILNTMRSCIMRIKNKGKVIDWCLERFQMYILNLSLPDKVDDPEAASDGIIHTYKAIIVFLEPLVEEAIDINSKQEEGSVLGDYLLSFFIFLCGKPFCCLNKYIGEEPVYKELVDNIVTQALRLTGDILYSLDTVSQRKRRPTYFKAQCRAVPHDQIWTLNISNMAYANFYFYVITKENYWVNVPQVYNSYYILEMCAYFFEKLLSKDCSISNGLIFMEHVIKRISPHSVDSKVLELDIYTELFQPITKVMIYSNSDEQRKKAVRVFQEYIEIFNMEARYTIILHLYEIVEHSGLLSFITGIFKSSIIQCLDSTPRNPQFLGRNMELLLKKVCNLPHGSSSDMVEISDEIITALNLLRFLFIRDKNNETGIWNMVDMLKNDYLNPLRKGIDLCKAHWRVKTKDLEQQKKDLFKEEDYRKLMKANTEVTLTVGGEQLSAMPLSQKTCICYQVLNGLDVMESILIRVNECINMNEKFTQKSDVCTE
ncbi:glomulin [Temnothorax nylanderi]|uniref:glomulin n=1 Tax=Temnothorax nylanderi TaxID=102681 RepID=UPI003A8B0C25